MGKFFMASSLMWDFTLEDIFEYAKRDKMSGIEFWSQQIQNKNLTAEKINELNEKFNFEIFVHAKSWDLNLASINKDIRCLSIKEVLDDIDLAKEIGAKEVTVHPGRFSVGFDTDIYYEFLKESFDKIINYSIKKDMPISIEIMEKVKKEFIVDIKSLKKLMGKDFNKVHYTLDVAHCDSLNEIYFFLNNLENISKVHISNRLNDKYHTLFSNGIFPMEEIITYITSKNIPMVLEGMETGNTTNFLDSNVNYLKERKII